MADSKIRLYNLLCFIANKLGHTAVMTVKTVLSHFYSSEKLAVAKILLMEDTDKLSLDTKRPYVSLPLRRDGDGRFARELDDILSLRINFTAMFSRNVCIKCSNVHYIRSTEVNEAKLVLQAVNYFRNSA